MVHYCRAMPGVRVLAAVLIAGMWVLPTATRAQHEDNEENHLQSEWNDTVAGYVPHGPLVQCHYL